jgi:hypothetical protein
MHVRPQGIENANRMTANEQLMQDMASDETGAAGEENTHGSIEPYVEPPMAARPRSGNEENTAAR